MRSLLLFPLTIAHGGHSRQYRRESPRGAVAIRDHDDHLVMEGQSGMRSGRALRSDEAYNSCKGFLLGRNKGLEVLCSEKVA